MSVNLTAFLGVAALVIVSPGQDTALTIRNTLLGGRRGGMATAAGVASGQFIWTVATSAGLAALIIASEPVFKVVKIVGAALPGLSRSAGPARRDAPATGWLEPGPGLEGCRPASARRLPSGRPEQPGKSKDGGLFSSLLPQFVTGGQTSFVTLLALGLLFNAMTLSWLMVYALMVSRLGDVLRRHRIRRALEAVTGLGLVGFGLRLATERR